jgi:hypothetical protein
MTLGKEALCRVSKIKHSAKSFFAECFLLPMVFCLSLANSFFSECPKKHSAKHLALGKELLRRVFSFTDGFLLVTRK